MPKFSAVVRGTRQDELVVRPRFEGEAEDAAPAKVAVRALDGLETEEVLSAAVRRAKQQGSPEPREGDPIYDFAIMVETVARATLDPDSPPEARALYFDGGPDQVRGTRACPGFSQEAIVLLYELQQDYQDRVAPTHRKLTPIEFFTGLDVLGGEDEAKARNFYYRLRPGMRWIFMRSMALQQRAVLTPSSTPTSSSVESSTRSESASDKPLADGETTTTATKH